MPSVLIVDDEPLIRWSVAESLEAAGYHVIEAGTARDALRCLERSDGGISVTILDLKLPDSSDLGLLRQIRQIAPGCGVILITAHGTREILDEALLAGAREVLGKPFDMGRIVSLVRDATAS